MEGDTSRITRTIEVMQVEGTIYPVGQAYLHGFGYQAVSVFLMTATGLDSHTLQTIVYPFLAMAGLGLTSFAFFSQVMRDRRGAILATLFLFMQPDVLFVTLRGSHEKLDWPLMMIALMLLHRSVGHSPRQLMIYVGLFYLTISAMIAVNVFFASTFLVAVTFSLVLGLAMFALQKRREALPPTNLWRLIYISGACVVLIFVFMTYVYPLATANLRLLASILDKVSALLLSFEIEGQPYAYIASGWVSPEVYLALTAFTWLLILASFAEWLWRGKRILAGRESLGLRESLDWLLYAGFAFQVALSVVVDFAGVLASNMQLRVFPGFTVLAVGLAGRGLLRVLSQPWCRGHMRRAVLTLTTLAIAWFVLASVLKASIEPALSNKWIFYTPAEQSALLWTDRSLRKATIWSSLDERLKVAFDFNYGFLSTSGNRFSGFDFESGDQYVLYSDTERRRSVQLKLAMPDVADWNAIYDNGEVQLHARPSLELSPP
jgi:hypothetical protein